MDRTRGRVVLLDAVGRHTDGRRFRLGPRGLALDNNQDQAATPDDRMTAVLGAAGSGKSIVLVERIARLVEAPADGTPKRILVTTFNVSLTNQLATWLCDRLGVRTSRSNDGDWTLTFPHATVRLLNWDKVPWRVLGHKRADASSDKVAPLPPGAIALGPKLSDAVERFINDDSFLEAELRRVVYGLDATTKADYLTAARRGRRRGLPQTTREGVWAAFESSTSPSIEFVRVWLAVLERHGEAIREGQPIATKPDGSPPFTHVFIDECQDFTPTDFRIASCLLPDANQLVVAGDETQSMRLAAGYFRPGTLRRRRWQTHVLDETYRLPLRLAEAVAPLAAHVSGAHAKTRTTVEPGVHRGTADEVERDRATGEGIDAVLGSGSIGAADDADAGSNEIDSVVPAGSRSGVLGTRPIVVSALHAHEQLSEIVGEYEGLWAGMSQPVTIAETQMGSAHALAAVKALGTSKIRASRMNQIKGLERPCVVWWTSDVDPADEASSELVYTILTRALHVAVIVIDDDTRADVIAALRFLRRDRLLFWDSAAAQHWRRVVTHRPDLALQG